MNCTFIDNYATSNGGGMYFYIVIEDSIYSTLLVNCSFVINTAYTGGGFYIENHTTEALISLLNCSFTNNTASDSFGGGIYNKGNGIISNCTFSNNESNQDGGAVYSVSGSIKFINCLFIQNIALNGNGGGIFNFNEDYPFDPSVLVNGCTFYNNEALDGNGIASDNLYKTQVNNSILWDEGNEIWTANPENITINFSDIYGGYQGQGFGNTDTNPGFLNAQTGNLHINNTSPCLDTGNNSVTIKSYGDLDDRIRITDGDNNGTSTVDMGVYEYQTEGTPVATNDNVYINEDVILNIDVLSNDFDYDGDTISILNYTNPRYGNAEIVSDHIEYTPDPNYYGVDSFSYTIMDINNNTDTATVTIIIESVNDIPVVEDDYIHTGENANAVIYVLENDYDIEGSVLEIDSITQPDNGITVAGTFEVLYIPNTDYTGTDTFTYTVSDGEVTNTVSDGEVTNTATVTVTIVACGDVNLDGNTDINDAAMIAQYYVGTIIELNCCE